MVRVPDGRAQSEDDQHRRRHRSKPPVRVALRYHAVPERFVLQPPHRPRPRPGRRQLRVLRRSGRIDQHLQGTAHHH